MVHPMSNDHGEADRFREMLDKIRFTVDDTKYILGDVIESGAKEISLLLKNMVTLNVWVCF